MPDRTSTSVDSADTPGETVAWRVEGMDCTSCVAKVRNAVERLPGVSGVEVNLMAERLTVRRRTPDGASRAVVERQVSALGYRPTRLAVPDAHPHEQDHGENGCTEGSHAGHDHAGHSGGGARAGHLHAHGAAEDAEERVGTQWWRTGKARLVALLGGLVAAAWLLSQVVPREAYWIYLVATLAALFPFGRRAFALARAGTPFSIETLMCAAALGAVLIGAAEEAAIVVLLFAVSELLENLAAGQARAGIRALASLIPRTARRESAGGFLPGAASRTCPLPVSRSETSCRSGRGTACRAMVRSPRGARRWTKAR